MDDCKLHHAFAAMLAKQCSHVLNVANLSSTSLDISGTNLSSISLDISGNQEYRNDLNVPDGTWHVVSYAKNKTHTPAVDADSFLFPMSLMDYINSLYDVDFIYDTVTIDRIYQDKDNDDVDEPPDLTKYTNMPFEPIFKYKMRSFHRDVKGACESYARMKLTSVDWYVQGYILHPQTSDSSAMRFFEVNERDLYRKPPIEKVRNKCKQRPTRRVNSYRNDYISLVRGDCYLCPPCSQQRLQVDEEIVLSDSINEALASNERIMQSFGIDIGAHKERAASNKIGDCNLEIDVFGSLMDIAPVVLFLYKIHQSTDTSGALIAIGELFVHYYRGRAFSGFLKDNYNNILPYLETIFSSPRDVHECQSIEQIGNFFDRIWENVNTPIVKAGMHVLCFAVAGVTCALTGASIDWNDFSYETMGLLRHFGAGYSTMATVSKLYTACRIAFTGFTSLFRGDVMKLTDGGPKMLNDLYALGDLILSRKDFGVVINKHADLLNMTRDFDTYTSELSRFNRTKGMWTKGVSFLGISLNLDNYMYVNGERLMKQSHSVMALRDQWNRMIATTRMRQAPFSACFYGGTGLGKSSVLYHISTHSAMWAGLSPDPSNIFFLNPDATHLDGYRSWQHTFVIDDVTAKRSQYCPNGDPQVLSIIPFINNVPNLTNQADLADKKTTPFLSRFFWATTNVKDLAAHEYLNTPAAVLRRMKYFITVSLNPEFEHGGSLDTSKSVIWMDRNPQSFPPFWRFTVQEYIPHNQVGANKVVITGQFMPTVYGDVPLVEVDHNVFLPWLKEAEDAHFRIQESVVRNFNGIGSVEQCVDCKMPLGCNHLTGCSHLALVPQVDYCVDSSVYVRKVQEVVGFLRGIDLYGWLLINAICTYLYVMWIFNISFVFGFALTVFVGMHMCKSFPEVVDAAISNFVRYTIRNAIKRNISSAHSGFVTVAQAIISKCIRVSNYTGLVSRCAVSRIPLFSNIDDRYAMCIAGVAGGLAALSIMCAAGVMTKKTNHTPQGGHQSVPDIHVEDTSPKWSTTGFYPIKISEVQTQFSPHTKCSSGASLGGVMEYISKSVFRCAMVGTGKNGETVRTWFNGFVIRPGVFAVNTHSLRLYDKSKPVRCRLFFSPTQYSIRKDGMTEGGDVLRVVNCHHPGEYVLDACSLDVPGRDLTLIYDSKLLRRGVLQYMVGPNHTNYMADPHMYSRDDMGQLVDRKLVYQAFNSNREEIGKDGNVVVLDRNIKYSVTGENTVSGDSGSVIFVHTGNLSRGDSGMLAIVGMHIAGGGSFTTVVPINSGISEHIDDLLRKIEGPLVNLSPDVARSWVDTKDMSRDYVGGQVFNLNVDALTDPHFKSPVNYSGDIDHNCAVSVIGASPGAHRSKQGLSTRFKTSIFTTYLDNIRTIPFTLGGVRFMVPTSNVYGPAIVSNSSDIWKVHRASFLDSISGNQFGVPQGILDLAIKTYMSDILARFESMGDAGKIGRAWNMLGKITMFQSLNGVPAKKDGSSPRIFDGVDWKTGAGYPYNKPKHYMRVEMAVPDDYYEYDYGPSYKLCDDVQNSVDRALSLLKKGEDPGFVYTCHLKDEIRTREKVYALKIRTINGCPIELLVICRMYLLRLVHLMQQYPLIFECAVGINSESRQWDDLVKHLREYGGESRWIGGDYGNFDKNQTLPISMATSRLMYMLCCHAHHNYGVYTPEDMLVIRTLLTGMAVPIVDHFGTFYQFEGTNPSGHPLTTQRNCLANGLYTRCAFIKVGIDMYPTLNPDIICSWYNGCVRQMHYGDDIIATVRKCCPWFNHDMLVSTFAQWGIPFTHANKCTDSGVKYINLYKETRVLCDGKEVVVDRATFLKRYFEYNDEVGAHLSPIDPQTIIKLLHWKEVKDDIGADISAIQLMSAAMNLLYCWGRQTYDDVKPVFKRMCADIISPSEQFRLDPLWVDWDEYIIRFNDASLHSTYRTLRAPPMPDIPDQKLQNDYSIDMQNLCGESLDTLCYMPFGRGMPRAKKTFIDEVIRIAEHGPGDIPVSPSRHGRPVTLDFSETALFVTDTVSNDVGHVYNLPGPAASPHFRIQNKTVVRHSKVTEHYKIELYTVSHCRWCMGIYKVL